MGFKNNKRIQEKSQANKESEMVWKKEHGLKQKDQVKANSEEEQLGEAQDIVGLSNAKEEPMENAQVQSNIGRLRNEKREKSLSCEKKRPKQKTNEKKKDGKT